MAQAQRPEVGKIGVGVAAIISNGKEQILVGKRKGGFGAGDIFNRLIILHWTWLIIPFMYRTVAGSRRASRIQGIGP